MKAYLINMHLLVPRSRSSAKVKVKHKGYISQKMAVSGAFVFHKHILFNIVIHLYQLLFVILYTCNFIYAFDSLCCLFKSVHYIFVYETLCMFLYFDVFSHDCGMCILKKVCYYFFTTQQCWRLVQVKKYLPTKINCDSNNSICW